MAKAKKVPVSSKDLVGGIIKVKLDPQRLGSIIFIIRNRAETDNIIHDQKLKLYYLR